MPDFYLVQRLRPRRPLGDRSKGFNAFFSPEYMGSSEFEWGALPAALRRMRVEPAVVEPAKVTINGREHEVFFVGHQGVSQYAEAMERWALPGDRGPFWSKERSHFPEVLTGTADDFIDTEAWWEITSNIGWTIDAQLATLLAAAFNASPPAPRS